MLIFEADYIKMPNVLYVFWLDKAYQFKKIQNLKAAPTTQKYVLSGVLYIVAVRVILWQHTV